MQPRNRHLLFRHLDLIFGSISLPKIQTRRITIRRRRFTIVKARIKSRQAMPMQKWMLARMSGETCGERHSQRTNGTTSIKDYCRRNIPRHGQHVGSRELSLSSNDVTSRLLSTLSSTSVYMNHQCDIIRSSDDIVSAERPFAMHNVRHKILIIFFEFFYLILILFSNWNRIRFKFIQILKIINVNIMK